MPAVAGRVAHAPFGCQSREEMRGYFENVVANLRRNPKENLICTLLDANADGKLLAPMELFANCVLLMAAGHETTTNLIGNGLLALLRNPDQLQLLRENPDQRGELRPNGWRLLVVGPLAATFAVIPDDRKVIVLSLRFEQSLGKS